MKGIRFTLYILITLFAFASCEDDSRDFSSDSGYRLEFSADTVRIDTLFTGIGSATKRLKVYNRNSKAINVESIELMNPEKSGFRMLVDGVSGNTITNEPIYGGDSIFILLEITIDRLNSDSPLLINDSIKFSFNGNTQYIQLEAVGQDAIVWHGKTIESDTILTAAKPYLIYDSLIVKQNAKLTIEPNVKLHFHNKAQMYVAGQIEAKGTIEQPIYFRGDRYDNILTDVPYNNLAGQWAGITIDSASYENVFENVRIYGTDYGLICSPSDPMKLKATFYNTIIHNSFANNLSATNCKIEAKNSQFSNASNSCVNLVGGDYSFIHCTLANYISWSATSHKAALTLGNQRSDSIATTDAPLYRANFYNCIIYGSSSTEVSLQKKLEQVQFEHFFKNCLIKANGSNDTSGEIHFTDNIWNEDPAFLYLNIDSDYAYNFELDSISGAMNKADINHSTSIPYDLKGVSRLSDSGPDIGCYEWIKRDEEE